jgi:DNA-binding response OmpR family regulator
VPFVVLTHSFFEQDKKKAAELGACDYLVKDISLPELVKMIQGLDSYWRK